ncbi:hypothetical protein LY76DRAFT_595247 [Colletotrichum caudatum]|nr:hypothetical protein LY76DRAFT_595247 [Colletotrichum caudatum]
MAQEQNGDGVVVWPPPLAIYLSLVFFPAFIHVKALRIRIFWGVWELADILPSIHPGPPTFGFVCLETQGAREEPAATDRYLTE